MQINNKNPLAGSDVLLIANDGAEISAHICILRQRKPIFFARYLQPLIDSTPRGPSTSKLICQINDLNSVGLQLFLRSVYTDEEVLTFEITEENNNSNNKDDEFHFKSDCSMNISKNVAANKNQDNDAINKNNKNLTAVNFFWKNYFNK